MDHTFKSVLFSAYRSFKTSLLIMNTLKSLSSHDSFRMRVLIVAVVCCLLVASFVDCKKAAKNEKSGKGKEVKAEKKEKVQKLVVEKVVESPVEEEV